MIKNKFCLYKEIFIIVKDKSALKENRGHILQNQNLFVYIYYLFL